MAVILTLGGLAFGIYFWGYFSGRADEIDAPFRNNRAIIKGDNNVVIQDGKRAEKPKRVTTGKTTGESRGV